MKQELGKMPWVCDFSVLDRHKLPWVGGKGANLGEMVQQNFPVPPGFCVTTRAYRSFMASGGDEIERLMQALDDIDATKLAEVRVLGQTLRDALNKLPVPSEIEAAVIAAWQQEGSEHSYAVRSSATAEDLPDASFAGQQDTYLNVHGQAALLSQVRACWASLFTERAIVYRGQHGFDHRSVALSVVVQQMVLPEVSGIMFTADPLHQSRQVISIDAGFGLGEALVSGKVSADLYKVQKDTLAIQAIEVADKQLAIWPLPGGGTEERALPEDQRKAQVLDEAQIKALAALGKRIEVHYGSPQDIEWCIADGQLYVVQSRPVTSLYPMLSPLPTDDTLHVYLSFNHAQVMLDPIKPLGISTLSLLLPFGKEGQVSTYNRYLATAGGRIYLDITEMMRHPLPHKFVPNALRAVSELISNSLKEVIGRERFQHEMRTGFKFSLGSAFRRLALPLLWRGVSRLWFRNTTGDVAKLTGYIDGEIARVRSMLEAAPEGLPRLEALLQCLGTAFYERLLKVFLPVMSSALISAKLVGKMTGRKLDDPLLSELMRGLEENVTTEMDLHIADVAEVARAHPAVAAALRENPTASVLTTLGEFEGGETFLAAFQDFLDKYGMRGPSEIDLTRERWAEAPTPLLQSIAGNLTREESRGHRAHHAALTKAGDAAGEKLIAEAERQPMGWLKGKITRRMVKVHRESMGVREHPKFLLIRLLGLAKEVFLAEAATQVKRGQLNDAKDIYYLGIDEIKRMATGESKGLDNATWCATIARRKADYERYARLSPPGVITSEGEVVVVQVQRDDIPAGALGGSPASAGIIEGIARVVLDPADAIIHDGEILVAPFTDPGWTPLFIHAAALVMEVGGLMTHGSVVAREYGIPGVVGVVGATTKIKSGQRIRVNGDSGYVEILDDAETSETATPEETANQAAENTNPSGEGTPVTAQAAQESIQ